MASLSLEEVAKHKSPGDLWMAIGGDVYDVSKFAKLHPGGSKILEQLAGGDATGEFFALHRKEVLEKYKKLRVGRLADAKEEKPGDVSLIPFAEPPYLQGAASPYYTEGHKRFQADVRALVDKLLAPVAAEQDLAGERPDPELKKELAMAGLQCTRLGPGPWLKAAEGLGIKIPGGVKPEEFDYFHEMIIHQEFLRLGTPGWLDGLMGGLCISLPCILNFGSDDMKATVGKEILLGDKQSCLAISEPYAGSDVAGIRTTADKVDGGYVVNGVKKWITEGMSADYFVTAVRTGGAGAKGISLLLVARQEGVETKLLKTTYSTAAGTALVLMRDVPVSPVNIIGKENQGFLPIMYNFNHERWMIVQGVLGAACGAVSDCFMWARQRKVFGKKLIDEPVIRYKLAEATSQLSALYAMTEQVTYDMCQAGTMSDRMGGVIGLLKMHSTKQGWQIADNCVQIMGGRGITKTGMGRRVENFKNFVKYGAVYGGSEEILANLAIKQMMKRVPDTLTAKL